jgi:hypothetical protein
MTRLANVDCNGTLIDSGATTRAAFVVREHPINNAS